MLSLQHVSKSYGATRAVDDVSLEIAPGEVVGLIGENGAGKSTLMRIVAGEIAPDSGEIAAPDAVGMVHQHFALVSHFTIAENLALVRDRRFRFVSTAALEREAEETIRASGIELPDVSRRAADLSVGERAKLELIKAVASHPDLLILDEPTSVLTPLESAELFGLIRRLAAQGSAIVFITHKIPEVMEVAERLVVMRRGRVVADTTRERNERGRDCAKRWWARRIRRRASGSPGQRRKPAAHHDPRILPFTPARSSRSSASPATGSASSRNACVTRPTSASASSPKIARGTR